LHSVAVRLIRHVRRDDHLQGQSPARLSVLSVLVFGAPQSPSELARIEQVSRPTMTRLLQGLERDGLVELRAVKADARRLEVRASAAGKKLLHAGRARRIASTVRLLEHLNPLDHKALQSAVAVLELRLSRARLPKARR
jgi:DNA-binding MarR family transcriptional regulator